MVESIAVVFTSGFSSMTVNKENGKKREEIKSKQIIKSNKAN